MNEERTASKSISAQMSIEAVRRCCISMNYTYMYL